MQFVAPDSWGREGSISDVVQRRQRKSRMCLIGTGLGLVGKIGESVGGARVSVVVLVTEEIEFEGRLKFREPAHCGLARDAVAGCGGGLGGLAGIWRFLAAWAILTGLRRSGRPGRIAAWRTAGGARVDEKR